ncbi:hypothetical protein E1193_11735 [Micromonospora sp. KC606]|uniref:hypothetical protein n=1 Tax=Micromonospora sp. KC606 TaxID=2530379 RepID=UPI0010432373|nr:hypothetical protein [Micromonospora sp. KC606]TDC82415.1 hypothetical protein E1193_11735 [Micromonospora sp. KC606]
MSTPTAYRVPEVMGFVAVPVRKEPGIVAHRVERVWDGQRTAGQLRWENNKGGVTVVPACLPQGQMPGAPHHELSSAMANHIGAVACTACFPDAEPR